MPYEMVTCPYDPTHIIVRHRMPYHLTKCKKQHTEVMQSCPFNAMHVFPASEMKQHILNCPDYVVVDNGK